MVCHSHRRLTVAAILIRNYRKSSAVRLPSSAVARFTVRSPLRLAWSRFPRIFRFGQAVIAHHRVIAGKGNRILGENGVFKLTPEVQLFFHAFDAFLLSGKTGSRVPGVGAESLRPNPHGPCQHQDQRRLQHTAAVPSLLAHLLDDRSRPLPGGRVQRWLSPIAIESQVFRRRCQVQGRTVLLTRSSRKAYQ